jgi:DNA-binding MarR family transcriptional regulator
MKKSLYDFYGFLLAKVIHRKNALFELPLAEAGLTAKEFGTMVVVSDNPDLTQKEVGSIQRIDRNSIGQIVDALEAKCLLERLQRADDRRAYNLRLTPIGKKKLEKIVPEFERCENELLSGLDAGEKKQFLELLKKIGGFDHV